MSSEHVLVKVDYNEYYDLGKGLFDIFSYDKVFIVDNIYNTPSNLANKILSTINDGFWKFDTEKEKTLYAHKIANTIFDWAKSDRLVFLNDQYLYELYPNCKETGSRYEIE